MEASPKKQKVQDPLLEENKDRFVIFPLHDKEVLCSFLFLICVCLDMEYVQKTRSFILDGGRN